MEKISNMLRLNNADFIKAGVVVVLVALLGAMQQGLTAHGLDLAAYDWAGILDISWKAGAAYLFKNLVSDENGKVLGRIG